MKRSVIRSTFLVLSCILACCLACESNARASDQLNKVKAVFLFKFFDYVSWPENHSTTNTLCTYGGHPFGEDLNYIAKMRRKKKTIVIPLRNLSNISECQILYIDEPSKHKDINTIKAKDILIVGSSKNIIRSGGIISMEEKFGRVHLSINLKNARANKLKISSRLLEIAEVIR